MTSVAFTLGLFGSFHCIGMCGALSCAFCNRHGQSKLQLLTNSVMYQMGRVATYTLMGILLGVFSELLILGGFQQWLSIGLGLLFVMTALLQVDIERSMAQVPRMQTFFLSVKSVMGRVYKKSDKYPRLFLGMLNGLLPCGMVYLAMAGAVTATDWQGAALFMVAFGLGTIPLMVIFNLGLGLTPAYIQGWFRSAIPAITFAFGLLLIARGWGIRIPSEIDFWEAIQNPVMCFTK